MANLVCKKKVIDRDCNKALSTSHSEREASLTNAIVFVNETKIEEEVINPNEEGKKEQE